jgi:micrococcal nuclease
MYIYQAQLDRVIDGDTVDAMVDLGFSTWKHVRIRLAGIDAPETRTRDLEEKRMGFLAKERVIELLQENGGSFRLISLGVDKYGRCLGEIFLDSLGEDTSLQQTLLNEGLATFYGWS